MKSIVNRIVLFLLLTVAGFHAGAQAIDSMMAVYAQGFPKEKIHIHFDKQLYNPDETIWYKVYLMAGIQPSPLSKNMYVEWYDTTGRMIKQTVAPLYLSSAKGSFDIPADYKGSFIHLKAFTRWMLNDDTAFLYERDLLINTASAQAMPKKAAPQTTGVGIFPEGGTLITGLNSRVAFKAVNPYGLPVLIKGVLVNDKKEVIDSLQVKHDGMGMFNLQPLPGEKYQLNWTDEFGVKGITNLPAAKEQGTVMNVRTTNEKAVVVIQRTANAAEPLKQMHLLIHMNQDLLYKVTIKMQERLIQRAEIPIDELPTGIVQFTLFSNDWTPVAERVVFVNNHYHEFNAKLNPITVDLDKRKKNVFEIVVNDTTVSNLSVAVTDAGVISPDQHTIFSDFLISSELKGYIHNPAYYFTSDTDSITAHLDLVMMTNGWRRFDWDKIKAAVPPLLKYMPETAYMSLKGTVFGAKNISTREPLQLNFILVGKDSSKTLLFAPVDKDGNFEDPGVFFYDTVKVLYNFNANNKLSAQTQVKLENGLMRKEPGTTTMLGKGQPMYIWSDSISRLRMNYFLSEQEKLRRSMASATLQEVIVKTKSKNPIQLMDEKYTSGLFAGGDGYSFDLTDDKFAGAVDLFTYLQGKVPGLQINNSGSQPSMSWRGATPDLFLNEMRSEIGTIQNINVFDVAYIKVFRPPFFGSFGGGAGGAIAIYTKKGTDARRASPDSKGMDKTVLGGYSRFREFYSPSYERPPASFEADVRNTLYWNPYIITNKKTPRFRVDFYNNDISKKLQIVLEGMNQDGKMIRIVKLLE
ncbi:MAG: hypothetical protein I8H66_13010 [Sphingobacteriia bacterium]|nr:hypothetical protein [Sphingobacteriia bacterium]